MNKIVYLILSIVFTSFLNVSGQTNVQLLSSDNGDGTFTNPLIYADFADPDIIRVGTDFYMVSSSMTSMPGIAICHSKDLINWSMIGHVYDSLTVTPDYSMSEFKTAYRGGTWAPTIRYHNGKYYVLVWVQKPSAPKDLSLMFIADKPEGPYSLTRFDNVALYDPGLFFDDDGRVYVAHGSNNIMITELTADAKAVKVPAKQIYETIYGTYLEGSHMYKRNGFYYIFNACLGYNGIEVVYRSKNIYGPYESKLILDKDGMNYSGAGIHQGGFVELENGESWFFLFQDRDYVGRAPVLQPMRWVDNWPVVGNPENENKAVSTYKKPSVKGSFQLSFTQSSDEFNDSKLKYQWEFNHNPNNDKWSLTNTQGSLQLTSSYAPDFWHARNTLTQKIVGPTCSGTVKIDATHLKEGDVGGLAIFGFPYGLIGIKRVGGKQLMVMQYKDSIAQSIDIKGNVFYLRIEITKQGTALFNYSLDNKIFNTIGKEMVLEFTTKTFLGNKFGLFCYQTVKDNPNGHLDFDWFHLESYRRGNHYDGFKWVDAALCDDERGTRLFRVLPKRPMQYLSPTKNLAWICFNNIDFKEGANSIILKLANSSNGIIEIRRGSLDGELVSTCNIKSVNNPSMINSQSFKISKHRGLQKIFFIFKNIAPDTLKFYEFKLLNHNN